VPYQVPLMHITSINEYHMALHGFEGKSPQQEEPLNSVEPCGKVVLEDASRQYRISFFNVCRPCRRWTARVTKSLLMGTGSVREGQIKALRKHHDTPNPLTGVRNTPLNEKKGKRKERSKERRSPCQASGA
jgi:hypothetical protein